MAQEAPTMAWARNAASWGLGTASGPRPISVHHTTTVPETSVYTPPVSAP